MYNNDTWTESWIEYRPVLFLSSIKVIFNTSMVSYMIEVLNITFMRYSHVQSKHYYMTYKKQFKWYRLFLLCWVKHKNEHSSRTHNGCISCTASTSAHVVPLRLLTNSSFSIRTLSSIFKLEDKRYKQLYTIHVAPFHSRATSYTMASSSSRTMNEEWWAIRYQATENGRENEWVKEVRTLTYGNKVNQWT
mgnify:CR=1 FL=1